jgi:hypothetical protein
MLLLALWRRISDYGVTEDRYIALVLTVWLFAMAVYFIVSRTKNIRVIPSSLCVLAVLVSFGPWGAFSVSERNQVARLQTILERDSLLVNGKVRKATAPVPAQDQYHASAVIEYLYRVHGYERIQAWFAVPLVDSLDTSRSRSVQPNLVCALIGIGYTPFGGASAVNGHSFSSDRSAGIDIQGYDRLVPSQFVNKQGGNHFRDQRFEYRVTASLDTIVCYARENGELVDTVTVDVIPLFRRLQQDHQNPGITNLGPEEMKIEQHGARLRVCFFFRSLYILGGNESAPDFSSYDMDILYAVKPQ